MYIISQPTSQPYFISAKATGHTFATQQVVQKGGFCFFVNFQATN